MIFYTSGLLFRAEPGYSQRICIPETLTCPFSANSPRAAVAVRDPDKTQERP